MLELMHRKHIGLMTSQSAKIPFAQSKTRILHSIYSTRISKVQVLDDQTLFLCRPRMDQGGLQSAGSTKCIIV